MLKPTFVIDTDIFIDLLRGVPEAKPFFYKIKKRDYIAYFSPILEVEVFSWQTAGTPEEERIITDVLQLMTRLDIDGHVAKKAGELRRKYGCNIPDALIAATIIVHKLQSIATRNKRHFETISEINVFMPY